MRNAIRMTAATLDVLDVLVGAAADEDLYGLKISQATGRPNGSVYPILARLEQLGWVESDWEAMTPQRSGARRRLYRLTPGGAVRARAALTRHRPGQGRRLGPAPGLLALLKAL